MFKTQKIKAVLSAVSVLLIFSLMFSMLVLTASAAPVAPGIDTTEAAYPATERPSKVPDAIEYGEKTEADDINLGEKMKDALTAVKKVIDIDDKIYTEFNYNYYPGDGYYPGTWYFNWNGTNTYISVSVMDNGRITSYNKYGYKENYYKNYIKLAEISKADAAKKAGAFLKKILGDEAKDYRIYYQNISYPSDRYSLVYVLCKDGYDYTNFNLYLDVDKLTGEIVNYSQYNYIYSESPEKSVNYQDASKVISKEEALKSYLDNIGVELVYTSSYDWETKQLTVKPVYRLKGNYNEYISAVSGEAVKIQDYYGIVPLAAVKEEAAASLDSGRAQRAAGDGGVYFSEAEIAGMKNVKDYITADKAIEIIAKAFDLDLKNLLTFQKNTSLYADYMDQNKYIWNISLSSGDRSPVYEYYYASVDAKTGTILGYSGYSYPNYYYDSNYKYNPDGSVKIQDYVEPAPIYSYDEVKEIALNKIKELCPVDFDKNFELAENADSILTKENDSYASSYAFNFVRKVNGIKFENNYIYLSFDNLNGKITGYNFSWYEKAKFPKLNNIISAEKALNRIADFCGYNIYYVTDGLTDDNKLNAVLVYKFDNSILVDPFTGNCIDWSFNETVKAEGPPDYKDLDGHWSEKIVNTLTDNGIYVWGGEKFDPDKEITKGELINYLSPFIYNSYYFAEMGTSIFVNPYVYRMIVELDKDLDKTLTKQEAAKIICEIAGYGELGKHYEIFVYPFTDDKVDEEYQGYVAILKAFGLVLGDGSENSHFYGTDNLTRAEAAAIIYNIIAVINK